MAKKETAANEPPRIKVVKIHNGGIQVIYLQREHIPGRAKPVTNKVDITIRHEPHMDLKHVLDKLTPHLGLLEDGVEVKGFEDLADARIAEILERYRLRHVQFVEKDEQLVGVRLGGYRKLRRGGHPLNILCPRVQFQSEGEKYEFAEHLEELIHDLDREVRAYVGGKHAEPGQVTMGFLDAEEEEEGGGGGED